MDFGAGPRTDGFNDLQGGAVPIPSITGPKYRAGLLPEL